MTIKIAMRTDPYFLAIIGRLPITDILSIVECDVVYDIQQRFNITKTLSLFK